MMNFFSELNKSMEQFEVGRVPLEKGKGEKIPPIAKSLKWVAVHLGGVEQEPGFQRTASFYCVSAAEEIERLSKLVEQQQTEIAKLQLMSPQTVYKASEEEVQKFIEDIMSE